MANIDDRELRQLRQIRASFAARLEEWDEKIRANDQVVRNWQRLYEDAEHRTLLWKRMGRKYKRYSIVLLCAMPVVFLLGMGVAWIF